MGDIIEFHNVVKEYPYYESIVRGFKSFILSNPFKSVNVLRKSKFRAIDGISFSIGRGEAIGIIGRNGAGKSTILALISGIIKPTSGRVVVRGKISPLLELGAGFHLELTGRENILLNGILLGLKRREVEKKMDDIIAFSELQEFIDQPMRTYSSGMVARLGFSVVAHLEPEILVIDEILAVGDMEFQKKCVEKITGFKKKGVTIVFVSHAMNDIRRICDRVIWIEQHKIRMDGRCEEVVKTYERYMEQA